jgi:hypothetical protein
MADVRAGAVTGMDAAIDRIRRQTVQKTVNFANAVGAQTIAELRSLTSEIRPPAGARTTAPMTHRTVSPGRLSRIVQRRLPARSSIGSGHARRAHPGHWADITGQLAASYAFTVRATERGAVLRLSNSAAYAKYLEEHDGFWVLSGAVEQGGPVDRIIAALNAQFGFTIGRV